MGGLFGPGDIAAFVEARRVAHAELGCAPNEHMTVNGLREMKIQAQATVAAFQALLADPAYRSRRLAFVISQTLTRNQALRALAGRDCRCFDTPEEAEAWLLDSEDFEEVPVRRFATR